ncbi:hypothetical protein ZWY2020_048333 [Hordeum vulgare]|nr:hypothetical protein ZWY2020_048333 [Hordeum vulgare]
MDGHINNVSHDEFHHIHCYLRRLVWISSVSWSGGAAARARPNELLDHQGPSVLQLVAQQFENTLVRILLAAGAVSFVLVLSSSVGALTLLAFVEPLVIFLILVVNAAVGVWQETNAEKALEALRQIQSNHTVVLRDAESGAASRGATRPGTSSWSASGTRRRHPGKDCMVFAGTTVVNGSAVCLVVHTGMAAEIGKIHLQIHEALQEDDDTPLKKKLNEFGEALTKIIGLICILVWLIKVK